MNIFIIFQILVYFGGNLVTQVWPFPDKKGTNASTNATTSKKSKESDNIAWLYTLSRICVMNSFIQQKSNIEIRSFEAFNITDMAIIEKCASNITSAVLNVVEDNYADNPCHDEFRFIYLNMPASYQILSHYCRKLNGVIITQNDLHSYDKELKNIFITLIKETKIATWVESKNFGNYTAWCTVLLINGSTDIRPCVQSISNNICKVNTTTPVKLFGNLYAFDHTFSLLVNPNGRFFLKGVESSMVRKIGSDWILQSNLHKQNCTLYDRASPFVRQLWNCGSDLLNLTFSTCSIGSFQCTSGVCFPKSARCNGKVDCDDESDEEHCQSFALDPGYSKFYSPPSVTDKTEVAFGYQLFLFSVADIVTNNYYAEVDLKIVMWWHDSRLKIWNHVGHRIDCSEVWLPKFQAQDSNEQGHFVPIPTNYITECVIKTRKNVSRQSSTTDPYMGEYCCNLHGSF